MATPLEELQKMMSDMRTPGTSRTPKAGKTGTTSGGTFNGKRVAGSTRAQNMAPGSASGTTRDGAPVNLGFSGGDSASIRRPGMTAGVSSVPTANPAARVARANRILETPVQQSRTSTEADLNPQVGEALRLSLIEQQRLSGPTYGSMGAFERRDRRDAKAGNQLAVDSNLAALQGIRAGAIDERGQNIAATATLEDRQMQEAGAFDRSLLGLDETMLKGQFGLADRDAANAGANPYVGATLDLIDQLSEGADTRTLMGLANLGRGAGTVDPAVNPWTTTVNAQGREYTGTGPLPTGAIVQELTRLGGANTAAGRLFLTDQGLTMTEDGRFMSVEEAAAQAAAAEKSREDLKAAVDWNAQQEALAGQRRQQSATQQRLQNTPLSGLPDTFRTPGAGVR